MELRSDKKYWLLANALQFFAFWMWISAYALWLYIWNITLVIYICTHTCDYKALKSHVIP